MKVGDKVWVLVYRGHTASIKESVIDKIGNKYITVDYSQYLKDTLIQNIDVGYKGRLYLDIKEYENEKEHTRLAEEIRKSIGQYGKCSVPLEKLKQIIDIINP